jgi:hypothetical protein
VFGDAAAAPPTTAVFKNSRRPKPLFSMGPSQTSSMRMCGPQNAPFARFEQDQEVILDPRPAACFLPSKLQIFARRRAQWAPDQEG